MPERPLPGTISGAVQRIGWKGNSSAIECEPFAAALMLNRAARDVGIGLEGADAGKIARAGSPEDPRAGQEIVFTGAFMVTRTEAADIAARLGEIPVHHTRVRPLAAHRRGGLAREAGESALGQLRSAAAERKAAG
jgi:hypothetical protein